MSWIYWAVPLATDEIHDKVIEMMDKVSREKILDVSTETGFFCRPAEKDGY